MGEEGAKRVDLFVDLREDRDAPLYRQLYEGIRDAILSGRIAPGARIPSTRDLAEHLDVSRTTVLTAVNRLAVEGFLETKVGSGTRVRPNLRPEGAEAPPPGDARDSEALPPGDARDSAEAPPALGSRGRGLAQLGSPTPARHADPRPFQPGIPALDRFPVDAWARIVGRIWREAGYRELTYGDPAGEPSLRTAIAGHLRAARGLECSPDQILVTAGAQQGLDLAARLLLDRGDQAWAEEPGYAGGRNPMAAAGAEVEPVPVDSDGLRVQAGRERAPGARMAYVTPSHQFPLGVRMSLPRRLELLRWASDRDAWILEDDYDSEFRFEGRPLLPLQGLDRTGRVLYVGSFSKTLFPSLRLGFVVLPTPLVQPFRSFRATVDQHPPTVPQLATAEFIDSGRFARHLSRMRTLYRRRHDVLCEALEGALGPEATVAGTRTGLHLVVDLPAGIDDVGVSERAAEEGVEVLPLSSFLRDPPDGTSGLVLGFAGYRRPELTAGVERLARAMP